MAFATPKGLVFAGAALFLASAGFAQADQAFEVTPFRNVGARDYGTQHSTPPPPRVQSAPIDSSVYYEDFRDGLAGWTFVFTSPGPDTMVWEYELNPDLSVDNGDARYQMLASPSVANGFMWLDYRSFTQKTNRTAGPPYYQLTQSAISPAINMSSLDSNAGYALYFYSYAPTLNIRNTNAQMRFVGEPNSAVTVFTVPDEVFRPNAAVQGEVFAQIPRKFLGVAKQVELVFAYDGDFYGWAVDDIYISALPTNEITVNQGFRAGAPDYSTPASQTRGKELRFLTDVANAGGNAQNVKLAITIEKAPEVAGGTFTVIYTDTLDYGNLAIDSSYENRAFPRGFPMPTELGAYRGTYRAIAATTAPDANPVNNVARFNFLIDETWFAKGPTLQSGTLPTASEKNYELGNIYYTPTNTLMEQVQIDSVEFGFFLQGSDDDGDFTIVNLRTYGYRGDLDANGSPSIGEMSDPNAELVLLGENFVEFPAGTPEAYYEYNLPPSEEFGAVRLPVAQDFIAIATAIAYEETPSPGVVANRFFAGVNGDVDYGAYNVAIDTLQIEERYTNYVLLPDNTASDAPGIFNFGSDAFYVNAYISVVDGSVAVVELPEAAFGVTPNPASTQVTLSYDFGTNAGDVNFTVTNAVGQIVKSFKRSGIDNGQLTLPVNDLNIGLYYISVTTADNRGATRKLLIQR